MSIKPKFVKEIISGNKKFEFRKAIFKRDDVESILVYASSPISKVIGEFSVKSIISDTPEQVWTVTKEGSGISKLFFDDYFSGKSTAHAIPIENFIEYSSPENLESFNVRYAPQSFCYVR
jgi:predicted transcriptional regulator